MEKRRRETFSALHAEVNSLSGLSGFPKDHSSAGRRSLCPQGPAKTAAPEAQSSESPREAVRLPREPLSSGWRAQGRSEAGTLVERLSATGAYWQRTLGSPPPSHHQPGRSIRRGPLLMVRWRGLVTACSDTTRLHRHMAALFGIEVMAGFRGGF